MDRKILRRLKEDASVSLTQVAKELKTPEPTVYFRVNRLRSEGVIKRYTIVTREELESGLRAAFLHTKNYLLSNMTERVVKQVGERLAVEPLVVFAARVDRARLFVAWRGDFNPALLEGVTRVEDVPLQLYKAGG